MVIGTLEARESARALADAAGVRPAPSGAGLTVLGTAASIAVFLALGAAVARDDVAPRLGALVGIAAGGIGGAIRAVLVSGSVADVVARYAAVPEWFVPVALGVFVFGSLVVTAVAGGALAFVGSRLIRGARRRPPA